MIARFASPHHIMVGGSTNYVDPEDMRHKLRKYTWRSTEWQVSVSVSEALLIAMTNIGSVRTEICGCGHHSFVSSCIVAQQAA